MIYHSIFLQNMIKYTNEIYKYIKKKLTSFEVKWLY